MRLFRSEIRKTGRSFKKKPRICAVFFGDLRNFAGDFYIKKVRRLLAGGRKRGKDYRTNWQTQKAA